MTPITGFAPDADPTTPGVLTDCYNCVPSIKGMVGAPEPVAPIVGLAALAAACKGSAVLTSTSGTRRHFAGTETKLYELNSPAWDDASRSANYTGTTDTRWLFDQFGNVSLASNDSEKLQWSTSGDFADVTAAPVSRIMFTTDNFVFCADYNHTAAGDVPDGWWCSAYQDYSSWTVNVSTQATSGRLIGSGGPLTAGWRLGSSAVLYKATCIFVGNYSGAPNVWEWQRVPGDAGCIGPEALVDIGGVHVFVGEDNIWMFDGTRPVPIANGTVRDWFFRNSNPSTRYKTIVKYNRQSNSVWIFYPSTSSSALDSVLVYQLGTPRWGRASIPVEAVVSFVTPGITWGTLDTIGATWDDLPDIAWDSPYWILGGRSLALFNTSHELMALTGASTGGGITTGDYGDDGQVSTLTASRLRFTTKPTSATAQGAYKMEEGGAYVNSTASTLSDGKFDHRQTGRFHRISYAMTGPFEVIAGDPVLIPQGQR